MASKAEVGLAAQTAPAAVAREEAACDGATGRAADGDCPSCGETLAGDYCHACGEKRPEGRDLSVRRFFGEAAQELTSVEPSKLFNTLRALMLRPGLLTSVLVVGYFACYLLVLGGALGLAFITVALS